MHRVGAGERRQPEIALVMEEEVKRYKETKGAGVVDSRMVDPCFPGHSWSVEALRGSAGLRRWSNDDCWRAPKRCSAGMALDEPDSGRILVLTPRRLPPAAASDD